MTEPAHAPARNSTGTGYRMLLCTPSVARMLAASLTGRLPTGVAPLAIVLVATASDASYATAGVLAAAYGLTSAIGQPALARRADRRGLTVPLLGAAALSAAAWVLLAVVAASPAASMAAVILAGLATPPLEGTLRALWPSTVPPRLLPTAFALDSASQTVIFVGGPLLVAAAVRVTTPATALIITGLLGVVGTIALVTAAPARRRRPAPREADLLGPLRSARLRSLYSGLIGVGMALGGQVVAGAAVTAHNGSPADAGVVLAAFSTGSLVGGLAVGMLTWRADSAARLNTLLLAFGLGWLPLLAAGGEGTLTLAALAAVPGLALAPLLSAAFALCADAAPTGSEAEAASWLVAAVGLGSAAGTALAGPLTDLVGTTSGYALAAAASLAAVLIARPHRIRS